MQGEDYGSYLSAIPRPSTNSSNLVTTDNFPGFSEETKDRGITRGSRTGSALNPIHGAVHPSNPARTIAVFHHWNELSQYSCMDYPPRSPHREFGTLMKACSLSDRIEHCSRDSLKPGQPFTEMKEEEKCGEQ